MSKKTYGQGGFSLIELLIALLVLGIGFTGYAALQIVGIRSVEDSYQRSQMTVLVEELTERMRANRQGVLTYAGMTHTQGADDCDELGKNVIDEENCERDDWVLGDDTCTPAETAAYDMARVFCGYQGADGAWSTGVVGISELASIDVQALPNGIFTVTGTWWVSETDRDDSKDQVIDPDEMDGNKQLMRQRIRVSVTP